MSSELGLETADTPSTQLPLDSKSAVQTAVNTPAGATGAALETEESAPTTDADDTRAAIDVALQQQAEATEALASAAQDEAAAQVEVASAATKAEAAETLVDALQASRDVQAAETQQKIAKVTKQAAEQAVKESEDIVTVLEQQQGHTTAKRLKESSRLIASEAKVTYANLCVATMEDEAQGGAPRLAVCAAMPGEGCPTRFSEERCMWIRPENLQLSDVRVRHMW